MITVKNALSDYIKQEIVDKNLNCFIVVIGKPGKGKSYLSLKLGEKIDPTFNIDRATFSIIDFMKLYQAENNLPAGSFVLFDEAGVGLNHRSWYDQSQKAFNSAVQVFRNKRTITCLTLPHLGFLDSDTQKMINIRIRPLSIIKSKNLCKAKVEFLQVNPVTSNIFIKRLRAKYDGKNCCHIFHYFSLPSKELVRAYELKKNMFNDLLFKRNYELLSSLESKENITKELKRITEQDQKILDLFLKGKNGTEIGLELNLSPASITYSKKKLINLGYMPRSSRKSINTKINKVENTLIKANKFKGEQTVEMKNHLDRLRAMT